MSISSAAPHVDHAAAPHSRRVQYQRFPEARSGVGISTWKCVPNVSGPGPRANRHISSQDSVVGIYDCCPPICILFMNVAPTVATGGCPSKNVAELPQLSTAIGSGQVAGPMAAGLSAG